jgi:hypothetical protein
VSKPWFGFTSLKPKPKPARNHERGLVWFQQTMVLVSWFETKPSTPLKKTYIKNRTLTGTPA